MVSGLSKERDGVLLLFSNLSQMLLSVCVLWWWGPSAHHRYIWTCSNGFWARIYNQLGVTSPLNSDLKCNTVYLVWSSHSQLRGGLAITAVCGAAAAAAALVFLNPSIVEWFFISEERHECELVFFPPIHSNLVPWGTTKKHASEYSHTTAQWRLAAVVRVRCRLHNATMQQSQFILFRWPGCTCRAYGFILPLQPLMEY